jgi:hypothetical protein
MTDESVPRRIDVRGQFVQPGSPEAQRLEADFQRGWLHSTLRFLSRSDFRQLMAAESVTQTELRELARALRQAADQIEQGAAEFPPSDDRDSR